MKGVISGLTGALAIAGMASGSITFHTDFDEASFGDITGLNRDSPGAPNQDFRLNTTNDTLDFSTTSADMWSTRSNAPIAWVSAPTVSSGQT